MGKVISIAGFLALLSTPLMAQSLAWTQIYSDSNNDVAHSIAVGSQGYAYVTGTSAASSTLSAMVLKLDVYAGKIAWQSTIGGNDSFGVAVVGYSDTLYAISTYNNGSTTSMRTMQLSSSNGSVTASVLYSAGAYSSSAFGLAVAGDASFVYVAGSSFNGTNTVWQVLKYNGALAAQVWGTVTYSSGVTDVARSCALDTYGNLYVTGYGTNVGMRTIRYDANGNIVWNKIGGSPGDQAFGVATDRSGNAIIAGVSGGTAGTVFHVIKYNGVNGNVVWDVTYSSGGSDFARGIATDSSGNAYVVGSSIVAGLNVVSVVGFRAADGSRFLLQQYGVSPPDDGWGIAANNSSNFFVAGSQGTSPSQKYLILGYSSQSSQSGKHTLLDKLLKKCGALGLDGVIFIASLYWIKKRFRRA